MLEQHLQQLVSDLELPPIAPKNEKGEYLLSINPETSLTFTELDPGFFLCSQIGSCPTVKKEEFFILLMKANLLGQGTGGNVIGLTEDENVLTLSLEIPYDLNYKLLRDAVEDFVNYVDFWRAESVRHQQTASLELR
jgi:hypothetical protein